MIKKEYLISVLICFCLILTSCDVRAPESQHAINDASSIAKRTLNFRITWDSYTGRGEAIKRLVDTYNADPESKVNIQLIGGNEDRIETLRLIEQEGDDTIFVLPYRYIKAFGHVERLHSLNAEFASNDTLFYEDIWQLGVDSGQLYGIPWIGHSICILYNEQLLKQANVLPSEIVNLSSFVEALKRIEQNTEVSGIGLVGASHNDVSWMVNQFIYSFGSSLVDSTTGKVVINNEKSAEAIRFYRDVLGEYAQTGWEDHTGIDVMNAFLNQEIAFEFQGVWGLTDIYKNGMPFEVGIIVPSTLGLKSEVGPLMLSLPKSMANEDVILAYDFMHYLITEEAQTALMLGEYSPEHDAYYPFRVPMRKDLNDTLIRNDYATYLPFIEGLANSSIDVPIPEWEQVKTEYYETGLHQVMTGEITIDSFLETLERIAIKLIDESGDENGD